MLIRRRVVRETPPQPDMVENNVTVVRPERPTGLLVGLGIATLLAIGAVTYLSWYLPNHDTYATQPVESGRAQRFESDEPAPKPNTVIVNPPPVIQTPPPVVTSPPIVTTPPSTSTTVIVPGASSSSDRTSGSSHRNSSGSNNNSNHSGTNTGDADDDTSSTSTTSGSGAGSTTGDVDGTIIGATGGGH